MLTSVSHTPLLVGRLPYGHKPVVLPLRRHRTIELNSWPNCPGSLVHPLVRDDRKRPPGAAGWFDDASQDPVSSPFRM